MVTDNELISRRTAALIRMRAPLLDAKKYLSEDHYRMFCKILPGAADAYLDGGKGCLFNDWHFDTRAMDYVGWSKIIKDMKEEDNQRMQAQKEYARYINDFNNDVEAFKEHLALQKEPQFAYPPALEQYRPHSWCNLRLPSSQEVAAWARPHIHSALPHSIAGCVTWKLEAQALTLPYATYEFCGVPCLTWCFRVSLMPCAEMELADRDPLTKTFCGHEFEMRIQGQGLGSLYLGPVDWGVQKGFTTPIALLALLARGEMEGEGIQLTKKDGSLITFLVAGYSGEVTISTRFNRFILDVARNKPFARGLHEIGVIDGLTARIMQKRVSALSPPATAGVPAKDDNSEVEAALADMGYQMTEIVGMIQKTHMPPGMSVENKVKEIVKHAQ